MLYLNEDEVSSLLDMPLALQAVEQAHRLHAHGEAVDVPRQRTRVPGVMLHMLQGAIPSLDVIGFKAYTTTRSGAHFQVHLFSASTGAPLAILAANRLGMFRTAAACALAVRELARMDATTVGMIGAGWHAQGQLEALCLVRDIQSIRVFARRSDALQLFCADMSARLGRPVLPMPSAEAAIRQADIAITITPSVTPVLLGEWLSPGMHITAAGSNALQRRELDELAVSRATLICVDSRTTALNEAGDLAHLHGHAKQGEASWCELGAVLNRDEAAGAVSRLPNDITLFESQGMAIQDLALAKAVFDRALKANVGLRMGA